MKKLVVALSLLVLVVAASALFLLRDTFLFSEINGKKLNFVSVEEAEKLLVEEYEKEEIELINGEEITKVKREDFSENAIDLSEVKKWGNTETVEYRSELKEGFFEELAKDHLVEAVPAEIYKDAAGFHVQEGVVEEALDTKKIKADINDGKKSIRIEEYIVKGEEDPRVKEILEAIEDLKAREITLNFKSQSLKMDPIVIQNLIEFDQETFSLYANTGKVREFVEWLDSEYATYLKPAEFEATLSGTKTLESYGNVGWDFAWDASTEAIKNAIENNLDEVDLPIDRDYSIGDSYIEVDIDNQRMFLYKDGALLIDTPVITGAPETPSQKGIFSIYSMERNRTLKGFNTDGTRYESEVSYWMPYNGGEGIHDATWQTSYTPDARFSVGSHGCINTPFEQAEELYNSVWVGYLVIVH